MNLVESEDYAECIRICIRKRKLHAKIRQLGYDIEDFVHEVLTRTFLTNNSKENTYAYGTIADKQLMWTLYAISNNKKDSVVIGSLHTTKSNDDYNVVDSQDYVNFVINLKILNSQEKQVMKLRYVDGMTFRESAKIIPLSHERIRTIEHTAVKKLQRFYQVKPQNS